MLFLLSLLFIYTTLPITTALSNYRVDLQRQPDECSRGQRWTSVENPPPPIFSEVSSIVTVRRLILHTVQHPAQPWLMWCRGWAHWLPFTLRGKPNQRLAKKIYIYFRYKSVSRSSGSVLGYRTVTAAPARDHDINILCHSFDNKCGTAVINDLWRIEKKN